MAVSLHRKSEIAILSFSTSDVRMPYKIFHVDMLQATPFEGAVYRRESFSCLS